MHFAAHWREIQQQLPENWSEARLQITLLDEADSDRAAALLAPAGPARHGNVLRFFAARRGAGPSPEAIRRLMRRLDAEGIWGNLELVSSDEAEAPPEVTRRTPVEEWDALVAALPDDWSDIYAELELMSSDHHEVAAILLSPLNPARSPGNPGFRFRIARRAGYGASASMARRCFERLDEEQIPGELHLLHVVSDTQHVQTQGPVWYVGGRAV